MQSMTSTTAHRALDSHCRPFLFLVLSGLPTPQQDPLATLDKAGYLAWVRVWKEHLHATVTEITELKRSRRTAPDMDARAHAQSRHAAVSAIITNAIAVRRAMKEWSAEARRSAMRPAA